MGSHTAIGAVLRCGAAPIRSMARAAESENGEKLARHSFFYYICELFGNRENQKIWQTKKSSFQWSAFPKRLPIRKKF